MFVAALLGAAKAVTEPFEPKTLPQARADIFWKQWFAAMKDEHKSLLDNITWILVDPPQTDGSYEGNGSTNFKEDQMVKYYGIKPAGLYADLNNKKASTITRYLHQ